MITVIVPVYNAATTLRRCVDSILRQSYRDFELLLIDDGSTDSSPLLCDAYARQDSRVRVFHKPNGGVSSARNVGLDHARGEWITFCDADDWVEKRFLESFEVACGEDLDMVVGNYRVVNAANVVRCASMSSRPAIVLHDTNKVKQYMSGRLTDLDFVVSWAKLYKKSITDDLQFDENLRLGEDCCFVYRYLHRTSSMYILAGEENSAYVYQVPQVGLKAKYRLSVAEATYHLISLDRAYEALNVKDVKREITLPETYYEYCVENMLNHRSVWYGNEEVRRICLRRSWHLGVIPYLRTWVRFNVCNGKR